jgi:O-antigen/teichoic acid export membrane protein
MSGTPGKGPATGFLRAAAVYGASSLLQRLIPLVVLPVLSYYLTAADAGRIAVFTAAAGIAGPFVGLNLPYAVRRRHFDPDREGLARYLANGLGMLGAGTVAAVAVALVAGLVMGELWGLSPLWLVAAVLVAGLQELLAVTLTLWQVEFQPARYARVQVAKSALLAGLTALLVIPFGLGWEGAAGAVLVTGLVLALAVALPALAPRLSWRYDPEGLGHALRYGGGLIPHTLGTLGVRSVDRLVIAHYATASETGLYWVGTQIGLAVSLVADGFNRAWSPWLYAGLAVADAETDRRIVRHAYGYFAAIAVVAVLVWLAAPPVIRLVLAPPFHAAAGFVGWVVVGLAFNGMYLVIAGVIFYAGRTTVVSAITVGTALVSVALMFLLVPRSGAIGAAQAGAVGFGLKFALTWAAAARVHPLPWLGGAAVPPPAEPAG